MRKHIVIVSGANLEECDEGEINILSSVLGTFESEGEAVKAIEAHMGEIEGMLRESGSRWNKETHFGKCFSPEAQKRRGLANAAEIRCPDYEINTVYTVITTD